MWHLTPGFEQDAFVFARIKYRSTMDRTSYAWWTDYRDADPFFSVGLFEQTLQPYLGRSTTLVDFLDELGLGAAAAWGGRIESAFWFVAIAMLLSGAVLYHWGEETHPRLNPAA